MFFGVDKSDLSCGEVAQIWPPMFDCHFALNTTNETIGHVDRCMPV